MVAELVGMAWPWFRSSDSTRSIRNFTSLVCRASFSRNGGDANLISGAGNVQVDTGAWLPFAMALDEVCTQWAESGTPVPDPSLTDQVLGALSRLLRAWQTLTSGAPPSSGMQIFAHHTALSEGLHWCVELGVLFHLGLAYQCRAASQADPQAEAHRSLAYYQRCEEAWWRRVRRSSQAAGPAFEWKGTARQAPEAACLQATRDLVVAALRNGRLVWQWRGNPQQQAWMDSRLARLMVPVDTPTPDGNAIMR